MDHHHHQREKQSLSSEHKNFKREEEDDDMARMRPDEKEITSVNRSTTITSSTIKTTMVNNAKR